MPINKRLEFSYFPGCSLETTARENNRSIYIFCENHDIELIELDDWNCCGSSSTHSIDHDPAKWRRPGTWRWRRRADRLWRPVPTVTCV